MKGKLIKSELGWIVATTDIMEGGYSCANTFPLHPDDVDQIAKDSLIFDNIEGRIASYPDVEFELIGYAKIKNQDKTYSEQDVKILITKAHNKITRRMGLTYSPSAFELQQEIDKLLNQS